MFNMKCLTQLALILHKIPFWDVDNVTLHVDERYHIKGNDNYIIHIWILILGKTHKTRIEWICIHDIPN